VTNLLTAPELYMNGTRVYVTSTNQDPREQATHETSVLLNGVTYRIVRYDYDVTNREVRKINADRITRDMLEDRERRRNILGPKRGRW
jgi:hypothetical protein